MRIWHCGHGCSTLWRLAECAPPELLCVGAWHLGIKQPTKRTGVHDLRGRVFERGVGIEALVRCWGGFLPLFFMRCVYYAPIWRGEPNHKQLTGRAWVCASLYRPTPPALLHCCATNETPSPFFALCCCTARAGLVLQSRVHCSSAAAQWYLNPAFHL
jgi:hypothetical protein